MLKDNIFPIKIKGSTSYLISYIMPERYIKCYD